MGGDVLIPLGVFGAVLGVGLGTMLWAYRGSGSQVVLFPEPVSLPPGESSTIQTEAMAPFERGCDQFRAGHYRQAADQFSRAIQRDSTLAEAYHNQGLAIANLRQLNEAVAYLVKASELYSQHDNQAGLALIKQQLEMLKATKK